MRRERRAVPPAPRALDRLKTHAVEGPPFLGLMLDEPTVRCLALGVVNARAQVAAAALVKALDAHTLRKDA